MIYYLLIDARGEVGAFLPLSDRKAVALLRNRIAFMDDIMNQVRIERQRKSEWIERFNVLEPVITENSDNYYRLCEYIYPDGPRFFVEARFENEWSPQRYDFNEADYYVLEAKTAQAWWKLHYNDAPDRVVSEFSERLRAMQKKSVH